MADVLARIAAYKREEVAARKAKYADGQLLQEILKGPKPRGFRGALAERVSSRPPALIAEIKRASPSRGLIRAEFDPPALASAYERGGATCLSVLTDGPSFGGDDRYIAHARQVSQLPILRKDFLVDPWQVGESRILGADAILVILAMVDQWTAAKLMSEAKFLELDALVEVHDEDEMDRARLLGADLIGINNRNLRTFEVDLATTERLAKLAPKNAILVAESGIFAPADVARVAAAGAEAILVGESLMRQADVEGATRALLGGEASLDIN